jgi:hypothetical protein
MPDTLAVTDSLSGLGNEGLQCGHIRLIISTVQSNDDEISANLTISHGDKSLSGVRMSFQQLDSEGQFVGRTAVEDTEVHLTVTLGEQVVNFTNLVVFFSSTLVSIGHVLGTRRVDNITEGSIGFRGQRLSNKGMFRERRNGERQLRQVTAFTDTKETEALNTTIYLFPKITRKKLASL